MVALRLKGNIIADLYKRRHWECSRFNLAISRCEPARDETLSHGMFDSHDSFFIRSILLPESSYSLDGLSPGRANIEAFG